jgi:hypothetical protein
MTLSYKNFHDDSNRRYSFGILGLILTYLVFELFFIPNAALFRDEFWFAHHIYQYTLYMPYRDFLPYKPVLGYYLLSIPMYFAHSVLNPLYYIKQEIAIINSIMMIVTAMWASQFFQRKAILLTLSILILSQLFLVISTELRVDMLASWFGLISVLCILSRRSALAGFIAAIGFLISQKALWFFVATNAALGLSWVFISRDKKTCWDIIKFNVVTLVSIAFYIVIWAHYSSLNTVLNSVFYEGYIQSKIVWYHKIYYQCWQLILLSGPLFVMLWPLTWISMLIGHVVAETKKRRFFILIYSSVMMLMLLSYQQAFPYNMVLSVPIFFLLYSDFFSWLFTLFDNPIPLIKLSERKIFWYLSIYSIFTVAVLIIFGMPNAYFFILTIPVCLGLYIYKPQDIEPVYKALIFVTILFIGIIYPLIRSGISAYLEYQYNGYQRSNILMVSQLLNEGGGYFAGTPLLYQEDQAIPGLKNLIGPSVDYLNHHNENVLPILIASLYLTPRTSQQILQDLYKQPVKLYVNNNRIEALPKTIQAYLQSQYQHFWGSIYLYAPTVLQNQQRFVIKFDGLYRVATDPKHNVVIDHKIIKNNAVIKLSKGMHKNDSHLIFRLQYQPDYSKLNLNAKYRDYSFDKLASN